MSNDLISLRRSPSFGVIPGLSTLSIHVSVPIDVKKESPIILTALGRGSVVLRGVYQDEIVLENLTNRSIPYLLVIVPSVILSREAWKSFFQQAKKRFLGGQ